MRGVLAAGVIVFALSGSPLRAQYDLVMQMTGFLPTHENQLFKLRVVNALTSVQVGEFEYYRIVTDSFSTTFRSILKSGETYNIDAFADFSRNDLYDPPPLDHAWRIVLSGVTGDTTVTLAHTGNWTDIAYPNPGDPPPDTMSTCDCDLNGDGAANVMDVVEWLVQVRAGEENPCLDYDSSGSVKINDLVRLLLDIRAGGCM